jgi:hypothetical protein
VNHGSETFEHRLLSYLYNQTKPSKFSFNPTATDYNLNQTLIGFIDFDEINRLHNQSNLLLYRLNRDNTRFDPSIFLIISIIIICMLIGNEWHRRIFIQKIKDHKHSLKTNEFKDGLIIGLLLWIMFVILYLLDRYVSFLIRNIYLIWFIICSSFMVFLCLKNFCCFVINRFYQRFKKEDKQWFQLILLLISFMMIILWFLNRFTNVGSMMTNLIVFCMTIGIISQMRVGSLMICMIVFGFICLFEGVLLIAIGDVILYEICMKECFWILGLKGDYKKNLILNNPEFPMSSWSEYEGIKNWIYVEGSIRRLYMNMVSEKMSVL